MSLDGIGSKIMLHKALDFTKDASSQLKQTELAQASMQRQAEVENQMAQSQVVMVNESEEAIIRREKERDQQQEERRRKKAAEESREDSGGETQEPNVGTVQHKIDIRI